MDRDDASARVVFRDSITISLQGVWLHAVTERQCIDVVFGEIEQGRGGVVHTVNLDHLRRLIHDLEYAALCRADTIRTADGVPLVWASRLQGTPLPERVSGSDLIWSLSERAAAHGRSVFLLGGAPGAAREAARILSQRYRHLRVAGICAPVLERALDEHNRRELAQVIGAAKPDLVFVALGSPKEEAVIDGLRASFPACWWIGVGITFSFVAGEVRRAPPWIRRIGLEWLHRLLQEPRLTKRYLIEGVPFGLTLLTRTVAARVLPRRTV